MASPPRGSRSARLLLIEDDAALRRALSDRLANEGYEVESAIDGVAGIARAASAEHDLIVLDVMLPGRSGFEIARDLRQRRVTTPVLMLTARAEFTDKVVGLQFGADDYMTKPFEFIELLARIQALLRRSAWARSRAHTDVCRIGDVVVDFQRAVAERDDRPVDLSPKEWQLLRFFVEHPGIVVSRNDLLDAVWGPDAMPGTRTVDVHVARLRQKLETDPNEPRLFLTARGLGYKFVPED